MKLKEYLEELNKFAKENPNCLEMEVVTSKDDEGNGFNRVHYTPTKGIFEDDDFIPFEQIEEHEREKEETNAVCLN